jgi:hypothetical protein
MDFRLQKQILLERAKRVEKKASRQKNAQAQDIMRALAALYREMAEELEDSGLFERRFLPLDFAGLAGGDRSMIAGPIISAGHGAP